MDNDITLLHLTGPGSAEPGTLMTTAPEHDRQYALPLGDAVVIGWGERPKGRDTSQLIRVWVDIRNAATCQANRPEGMPSVQITEKLSGVDARSPSHAGIREETATF